MNLFFPRKSLDCSRNIPRDVSIGKQTVVLYTLLLKSLKILSGVFIRLYLIL